MLRTTFGLGLSELHRLCNAEVQDGAGLLEKAAKA